MVMKKCLCVGVLGIAGIIGCANMSAPKDGVVSVNGTWLKGSDIERFSAAMKQEMMSSNPESVLDGSGSDIRKKVVRLLVANELLLQEAKRKKITIPQYRADSMIGMIKKKFPDEATFTRQLASSGQTMEAFAKNITDGLVLDSMMRSIVSKLDTISFEQCKKYYDDNQDLFASKKKLKVRHIVALCQPNATEQEKQSKRAGLEKILVKAKSGADFAALARQYSESPDGKSGGDIGWFSEGDVLPGFDQAAAALKNGEISDLVETSVGFHIIKKEDEKLTDPVPFDSIKAQIRMRLDMTRREQVLDHVVDSLIGISRITFKDTTYSIK